MIESSKSIKIEAKLARIGLSRSYDCPAHIPLLCMKIVSWNVNGLRAVLGKGFLDFAASSKADVLCLQETKCVPGDVQHVEWPTGYTPIFNSAQKKGYSGTCILSREKPVCLL